MTLQDRLVDQTRLFRTTSLFEFHRFSCNESLVICIREAAKCETLEIKYRKMMEDNNVEKVTSVLYIDRFFYSLVKNTPLRVVFSTLFSLFEYPDETLSLVLDIQVCTCTFI